MHEIDAIGADRAVLVLEDLAPRPLAGLPPGIAADFERSDVSIFAAQAQARELGSRIEMTDIVNRRRMRHGHMVNITKRIMCEGMRADFHQVDRLSAKVIEVVAGAGVIRATTPAGTDITARLDPALRWIKTSGLITPDKWGNLPGGEVFGGLTRAEYVDILGRAILGTHDPAEVVLLEIEPDRQKTRPDFAATELLWGVRAVDLRSIERQGRRLVVRENGRTTPVRRIYNRVVPDELARRGLAWPFGPEADVDVEWAGGPDWFCRVSKFSLPWLRHSWVPRTRYLPDALPLPDDRSRWVLKPLLSFAGGGIVFGPTDEVIAAIPEADRERFILQERVSFSPVIDTPHGATQLEVRVMMVRAGGTYRATLPLGRMGRGLMMGVDHNRNLEWVGATAVLMSGRD